MPSRLLINEMLLASVARVCGAEPALARFDSVVGRLRASGYFALRPHLEHVPKVRILVGIDVDAHLARHHRQGLLFQGDPVRAVAEVEAALRADIEAAPYRRDVEAGIREFAADVASRRVELRAHPSRRLSAKMCVFVPEGFGVERPGAVITGSSDLAAVGLLVETRRFELDVLLREHEDVRVAADEFERLWQESIEVVPEAVTGVAGISHLREDITPFELYIKFLSEYFGPAIEHDPGSETDLPRGIRSLAYQTDAVNDGWLKLQK
ncbi:MAG: hypothetical protein JNK56_00110, partial [Myxococcales bacterium]|nr:hypothetical protein [Myxococcales bacterium]